MLGVSKEVGMKRLMKTLLIVALVTAPTTTSAPDDRRTFVPSEEISADRAIALPVDI